MSVFGTEFCDHISIARYIDGAWQEPTFEPLSPLPMHPAAHVFHYASTCFEGFKAYRWQDGHGRIFRLHDHVARMQKSAASLRLPVPDADMLAGMVIDLVSHQLADIPEPPHSLYLRPTLIGTLQNIGAAAAPSTEATLFVLGSPVGDYFAGGAATLKLLVEDQQARTTEQLGSTKTGGNYAAALGPTLEARENELEIKTKNLEEVNTTLKVLLERRDTDKAALEDTIGELLEWVKTYEATLSGTAACLSPVGALVYNGEEIVVRDGGPGPNTARLQKALQDIQYGLREDTHGWLTEVSSA